MPFNRPDLATLISWTQADIQSRLPSTQATLRHSLVGILSRMQGGLAHGLYGYLDWLALQIMPDTAETEHLERWASIWGIYRKTAGYAAGIIQVTGQENAIVPENTIFMRQDGTQYKSLESISIGKNGIGLVSIQALKSGIVGNASPCPLSLASPLTNVQAQVMALEGLAGGFEEESDAYLRRRLLTHIQRTPMGGRFSDYEAWALEVKGVTRAFVTQEMGKGTVSVRFMMDNSYPNGIPTELDREKVAAHIETRRPVTAEVFVVLPLAEPLTLKVSINPDTPQIRREAESQLLALLQKDAVPGGIIYLSRLSEALSHTTGENDHVIHSPTENICPEVGKIIVYGGVEWIT